MPEHLPSAAELAEAIRQVAHQAHSEEDVRIGVEKLLAPYLRRFGVAHSKYETATRVDAQHGNVLIEYERAGKLSKPAGLDENISQLKKYLLENAARKGGDTAAALRRMVGVGLDGDQILFVRYHGRKSAAARAAISRTQAQAGLFPEAELGDFAIEGPRPVSPETIERFLSYLPAFTRRNLTPEALAETFGPKSKGAQAVVGLLYRRLLHTESRRVKTFFAEWQRIFGIVYGQEIGKAQADARALGKQFGVKTVPKLNEFLFAVHTYFALLMKLLAAELMTLQPGSMLQSFLGSLATASQDELKKHLRELEEGGLFARQGIVNFLEGDFFAWYFSEWDKEMAQELRGVAKALSEFDPITPYLVPEQSRDLLKKLYQYLVPKKLRHDLGEYYTPDWLAEHVLNQLGYNGNLDKRLLDPACGSGTFLVSAIGRMKDWALHQDPPVDLKTVAEKILANLCGFDINPIAVIAARTNFLLAMGQLVRHARPIEIPIYMCDSVLTPAKHRAQTGLDFRPGYDVPTRAGTFVIPREIVDGGHMDKFTGILEQCVRTKNGYPTADFVHRVEKEISLHNPESRKLLEELHAQMLKLEKQDRNRIWARFIKNSFAPVFKGQRDGKPAFDFVAGNPPWVNWDNLSDEYKDATRKLWADYGFFTLRGYRALLPAGKLELATLFTYACADAYLAGDGRLGFVITQTVFKTSGAADGFRRFTLPAGVPLGVTEVHDFVELKPFEGAQNRTATLILEKGSPTRYPLPYIKYEPTKAYLRLRRQHSFEPPIDAVLASVTCQKLIATPVSPSLQQSPWITTTSHGLTALGKVFGSSSYGARKGIYTLGAKGAFWLEGKEDIGSAMLVANVVEPANKREVPKIQAQVEKALLFPLLRGRDVERWYSRPSLFFLLTHRQDNPKNTYPETELRRDYPKAYAYLSELRSILKKRPRVRKFGLEWYAVGDIGPYSVAPFRVVWRYIATDLICAVVSVADTPWGEKKTVLADHKLCQVAFEKQEPAHLVCSLLNSLPARAAAMSYVVGTQISTHIVQNIRLPQFDRKNATHIELCRLSQRAHELAAWLVANAADEAAKRELARVEDQIDRAAAQLWGLTDAELDEIRHALELLG